MLSRDYILRLIQEFTEAIELLLKKKKRKDDPEFEVEIQSMYRAYFNHPSHHYYSIDAEFIINELREEYESKEFFARIDMLSELIYQDALCKSTEEEKNLLSKALYLIEYLDKNSDTFSFQRRERIEEIKKKVSF